MNKKNTVGNTTTLSKWEGMHGSLHFLTLATPPTLLFLSLVCSRHSILKEHPKRKLPCLERGGLQRPCRFHFSGHAYAYQALLSKHSAHYRGFNLQVNCSHAGPGPYLTCHDVMFLPSPAVVPYVVIMPFFFWYYTLQEPAVGVR